MPTEGPLVLIGENNAGKSNVSRAIDIMLGERWPTSFSPEDHDFYGRRRRDVNIQLRASTDNVYCRCGNKLRHLALNYVHGRDGGPVQYSQVCTGCDNTYVGKQAQSSLLAVTIAADRNLRYQLSYSSRYTLLSRLMHRFHERLTEDEHRVEALERIFGELLQQFQSVDEFQNFNTVLLATTRALGQNIEYALEVDFSAYNPSNFFRSLQVNPNFEREVRAFDELGTGQLQILAMSFAYAYAKAFGRSEGLVLLIDEPESNLHPLAQQWLSRQLSRLVTSGLQIILTTHSPEFVDLGKVDNLVRISKAGPNGATRATQNSMAKLTGYMLERGVPTERATEQSLRNFYATAATTETLTGLFARRSVLVEGPTEALALPEIFRKLGYEPLRAGVAFISVDGISNIAKWVRLYGAFEINTFAFFDTDHDKSAKKLEDSRTAQTDIMRALLADETLVDGLVENALTDYGTFCTFGPNFEGAMRQILPERWVELEAEASDVVGTANAAKPLRARYAIQSLEVADFPQAFRAQIEAIAVRLSMTKTPSTTDP